MNNQTDAEIITNLILKEAALYSRICEKIRAHKDYLMGCQQDRKDEAEKYGFHSKEQLWIRGVIEGFRVSLNSIDDILHEAFKK